MHMMLTGKSEEQRAENRVHGRSTGCRTWDPRDKNNETTESSGWWTTLRIEAGIYFPQGVARGLRKTEGNEEIAVINTYHLRARLEGPENTPGQGIHLVLKDTARLAKGQETSVPPWPAWIRSFPSLLGTSKTGSRTKAEASPSLGPRENNNKRGPTWSSTREGEVDPVRFHQGEHNKRLIVPASSPWEMKLPAIHCG